MIDIAMVIEMTQDDSIHVTSYVMDENFLFALPFKKHATHKIIGSEYSFYIEERCFANLTRKQAIALCQHWIENNKPLLIKSEVVQ